MSEKSSNGASCLFCKIGSGEIPAVNIYEDEHAIAFLDIKPVSYGHTLIVPKEHSRNIFDISDNTLQTIMPVVKKVATAVREGVGAGGINIHINNEPPAGQEVFHTHIHIIPRFSDDGKEMWKGKPYEQGEMEKIADSVRKYL